MLHTLHERRIASTCIPAMCWGTRLISITKPGDVSGRDERAMSRKRTNQQSSIADQVE